VRPSWSMSFSPGIRGDNPGGQAGRQVGRQWQQTKGWAVASNVGTQCRTSCMPCMPGPCMPSSLSQLQQPRHQGRDRSGCTYPGAQPRSCPAPRCQPPSHTAGRRTAAQEHGTCGPGGGGGSLCISKQVFSSCSRRKTLIAALQGCRLEDKSHERLMLSSLTAHRKLVPI
jgi:hypothetical protein